MALKWPFKDPNEVLDYEIIWSARLLTDTIDTSIWTLPAGITKDSDTHDDSTTTIWLSGGSAGETYAILNRITTDGGRTMDQTVNIKVKDK